MSIKLRFLILYFFALIHFGCSHIQPVDYVDVFIGTSNSRWMLGPYACVPFGMVQLGPDNQGDVWMGGYEYSINNVRAFSHIHAWTMSGLAIMPASQDLTVKDSPVDASYRGAGASYHSRIEKHTEKAYPGYYSVYLYDASVKAELTATTRCGFHRYTFEELENTRIMIDLEFPDEYQSILKDAQITKVDSQTLEGFATSQTYYGDYTLYFVIELSKPFKTLQGWSAGKGVVTEVDSLRDSIDVGAFVTFDTEEGEEILLKTGLSLVDLEGARRNLEAELGPYEWDFDAVAKNAKQEWNKLLSKVKVEGGTEEDKTKFYTNLYRSYAQKQTWSDVDGRYRDPMERIQQLPAGGVMYGGDAFWNSYWNLNGLWSLLTPEVMNNWVGTQLELFDKTGWTNNGPTGLEHTGVMEVSHEVALMVAAYMKGIRNYDQGLFYRAIKNTMSRQGGRQPMSGLAGMDHLNIYTRLGYVPFDVSRTDRTLNYAFSDYCFAQLAKAYGNQQDYDFHIERSNNWKNLWHPDFRFITPKDSAGNWIENFSPFSGYSFSEGNAWQYSWYIPHDIPGLVELLGRDSFNARLEYGFQQAEIKGFAAHAFDRSRKTIHEYYINHGNQANMQAAFLFNYAGKPWLTQEYSRKMLDVFYGSTPYHGWDGDEDEGQMGAWYVMSAMGLFEMTGGTSPDLPVDLTSPLFDKITLTLDTSYYAGAQLIIETRNNAKENVYIQKISLNGKALDQPRVSFEDLVKGGHLIFDLGPRPHQ
ncbi:MAG: glycoside hydrolase family 92 protein [Saprospiraceae bacterium]|nr:glycoside hydrolase family 92 protein [Saprospiraceae bacterium]